jgi:hypothetical protein
VQLAPQGEVKIGDVLLLEAMSVSYLYPPAVLRQEEKLMQLKKLMQNPLDGRAKKIEKPCLKTIFP